MKRIKKITLCLPEELVNKANVFAKENSLSLSAVVAASLKEYIKSNKIGEIRSLMIKGYGEMAKINLSLAEESVVSSNSDNRMYEEFLSESE
jgi:CopG family transcriptional regulator/antitoxin EndoAI